MRHSILIVLSLLGTVIAIGQGGAAPVPPVSQEETVMLAAVARDKSRLTGGFGPSEWMRAGTVTVEPIARLTPSGKWVRLLCSSGEIRACRKFAREYLSKTHAYTVVSADGNGATVNAIPTTLSECYGYSGTGRYSGAPIANLAIAASSAEFFEQSTPSAPLRRLKGEEAAVVRKSLAILVPKTLDSTKELQIFAWRLQDKDLFILQRNFADFPEPEHRDKRFLFAIGTIQEGHFHVLRWKQNMEDEDERAFATIRLKNGREFLVTVVTDPESQSFRVYSNQDGHLKMTFSGGGSSC